MSSRSGKDRKISGRRQNGEEEPFLVKNIPASPVMRGKGQNSEEERFVVENIPGSPVMRGRRQNSEEERFVVENIPGSPVMRGRRQNSEPECFVVENIPGSPVMRGKRQNNCKEEYFLFQDISKSPVMRGKGSRVTPTSTRTTLDVLDTTSNVPGWNLTSNVIANRATNTTTMLNIADDGNRHNVPPNNEDAPPSYESSIPPNHIGWSPNVTSKIPFPMPYSIDRNDERLTFAYPPTRPPLELPPSSPIELSPLAKSYLSIESPNSRSPGPSTSPSPSPSPDRLRPAYTYQQRATRIVRTPPRPPCRREYESDGVFAVKSHNEFSYKYGGFIMAIFVVIFLMILSLVIRFLIRNSFKQ